MSGRDDVIHSIIRCDFCGAIDKFIFRCYSSPGRIGELHEVRYHKGFLKHALRNTSVIMQKIVEKESVKDWIRILESVICRNCNRVIVSKASIKYSDIPLLTLIIEKMYQSYDNNNMSWNLKDMAKALGGEID